MLDLELRGLDDERVAWRGRLPAHTIERLVADAHLAGVLAGRLPNDGAPVRVDDVALEESDTGPRARVVVGAGTATFTKRFVPALSLRDDAEAIVARLCAGEVLGAGRYRFVCRTSEVPEAPDAGLRVRPLPRRLPPLAVCSLRDAGLAVLPACRHPTLLLPRVVADRLVAHARQRPDVEVGAVLRLAPFLGAERVPVPLAVRICEALPLEHGITATRTRLRVTPQALAAVRVGPGETLGLAHSHPFGDEAEPHALSRDDRAMATSFFWRPFAVQLVIDPRFASPERALAAFAWVDAALVHVCIALVDD